MACVYFISGHTDLSEEDFICHYEEEIQKAIDNNGNFVIGDAKGSDLWAQLYIRSHDLSDERVTIYHMFSDPYNGNPAAYPTEGGFKSHNTKDSAMTKASGHDIAYVRSIEEQQIFYGQKYKYRMSGTERNIKRRGDKLCPICKFNFSYLPTTCNAL